MAQQVKISPLPGVEITIDSISLLFHLAEQTSAEEIAFALLKKYGANPLLEALKPCFNAKETRFLQQVEKVDEPKSHFVEIPPIPELPKDLQVEIIATGSIVYDPSDALDEVDEVEEFLSKPKPVKIKQTDKTPLITCARPGCGKVFLPKKGQRYCDHRCSQKRWADKNREETRKKGRERYHNLKRLASQPDLAKEGEQQHLLTK